MSHDNDDSHKYDNVHVAGNEDSEYQGVVNDDDHGEEPVADDSGTKKDDELDHHKDDDEDDDDIMLDLDAELANLDIDKDFRLSILDTVIEKDVSNNVEYSMEQLARDEVFSKHYHPTQKEMAILTEWTKGIVVTPSSHGKHMVLKRGTVQWKKTSNQQTELQERDMMLLTHGVVMTTPNQTSTSTSTSSSTTAASILSVLLIGGRTGPSKKPECILYDDIAWVKDVWQLKDKYCFAICISPGCSAASNVTNSPTTSTEWHVECESAEDKQYWLDAWERVLLKNRLIQQQEQHYSDDHHHASTSATVSTTKSSDSIDPTTISETTAAATATDTRIVGWQHELVQTSLYTAGVTGMAFFGPQHIVKEKMNARDTYNQWTPLHYAAYHNQIHVIQFLLEQGANPEIEDDDGRTPMYYAMRENLQPAVVALKEGGAQDSRAYELEQHGTLVEAAREHEKQQKKIHNESTTTASPIGKRNNSERRRSWMESTMDGLDNEIQTNQTATPSTTTVHGAQTSIKDALSAIHARGAQIQNIGDKTEALEQSAAEYTSLAAQVRAKLEKKNKGLNFLNPFSNR